MDIMKIRISGPSGQIMPPRDMLEFEAEKD